MQVHRGQRDRYGRSMIEHVAAVVAGLPDEFAAVAWVHDVCERSRLCPGDVAASVGLDADELGALELLTRRADETLLAHTARIAAAPGRAGRLARVVKAADIAVHRRREPATGAYRAAAELLAGTAASPRTAHDRGSAAPVKSR